MVSSNTRILLGTLVVSAALSAAPLASAAPAGPLPLVFAPADEEEEYEDEEYEEEVEAGPAAPSPAASSPSHPGSATPLPDDAYDRKGRLKRRLPAEPGVAPPKQYYLDTTGRPAIWGPGIGLLAGGFVTSISLGLAGVLSDVDCRGFFECDTRERPWGWSVLPLAGPFVIAASNEFESGWRIGYGVIGVMQNAGLAMIIAGTTVKRDVWTLKNEHRHKRAPGPRADLQLGPGWVGVKGEF